MKILTKEILKKVYFKKDPWSHKGDYGRLLIVSGSKLMTGSPALIGLAALRAGCDVLYFIGPERAMDIAAKYYPSFITSPLKGDFLNKNHVKEILDFASEMRITCMVIGPGLYRKKETKEAILDIIKETFVPMVIDADALRAITSNKKILNDKSAILTPHENEFYELTGISLPTNIKDRIKKVQEETYKLNCNEKGVCPLIPNIVMVVKGHIDVVSNGKESVINKKRFGEWATKGGFGDTLAGICGALLARRKDKVDTFLAAQAATYINGRAIDIAYQKYGKSTGPLDLIESIPKVLGD